MKLVTIKNLWICLLLLSANTIMAQTANNYDFERIEDNSFLLEEAYNQEAGVIQHISAFQYMKDKTWAFSFTDEWPVPGQKHQLSVTIPVINNGNTDFGDIALNYRYQAVLTKRLAFSPRFSLLLPNGNYRKGMGNGILGYQANLPLSFIWSHKLVTHFNLGTTFLPSARDILNNRSDITNINYGASTIILLTETFNFMLEATGNSSFTKPADSGVVKENTFFINPGFRYAFNFKSGLQIVPGLAVPVGFGPSNGHYGIFAYLSFEHSLRKQIK